MKQNEMKSIGKKDLKRSGDYFKCFITSASSQQGTTGGKEDCVAPLF